METLRQASGIALIVLGFTVMPVFLMPGVALLGAGHPLVQTCWRSIRGGGAVERSAPPEQAPSGTKPGTLRHIAGLALIVVGLVAVPIPIVPGIPLIVAGAAMLGSDHPMVRSGRTWLQNRGILTQEGQTRPKDN